MDLTDSHSRELIDSLSRKIISAIGVDEMNDKNDDGWTFLHHTVKQRFVEETRILLQRNMNPNVEDREGDTPLHLAVTDDDESSEILVLLLDNLANINSQNKKKETPLQWAVMIENIPAVKILLERKASMNLITSNGHTALDYAIIRENQELISLIEEKGGVREKFK
jgi:ankyrin repeat protein